MDKFVISKNQNRNSEEYYVVHLLNPIVIFSLKKATIKDADSFSFSSRDGVVELWRFDLHFADVTFPGFGEKKLNSIKMRAWRWCRSFLENKK